jgi:hypothetical protein
MMIYYDRRCVVLTCSDTVEIIAQLSETPKLVTYNKPYVYYVTSVSASEDRVYRLNTNGI